jgi:hypothetical protein
MFNKLNRPVFVAATMLTSAAASFGQGTPDNVTHGDPYTPVGTLGVNPTHVQTGVKPNLSWEIDFPSVFEDLTLITPPGGLVTTTEVTVVVQVPGVSGGCDRNDLPVAFWMRAGASNNWQLLFNDTGKNVNPSKVLFRKKLPANTQIDFAARAQHSSGAWHDIYWTLYEDGNLQTFVNGDPAPDDVSDFLTGDMESFLTPYLSEDGTTVVLGPKEMLYLLELESGTPGSACYDRQDLAFTVQFITKNNNGHGNNVDGVDVSNPGSGKGGPNGEIDPSGEVDDEQPKGKTE